MWRIHGFCVRASSIHLAFGVCVSVLVGVFMYGLDTGSG